MWSVRVTLVVTFGFLSQNFWGWFGHMNNGFDQKGIQFEWWQQSQVVGTFKPYLLFKIVLHSQALGMQNLWAQAPMLGCEPLRLSPMNHLADFPLPNIYRPQMKFGARLYFCTCLSFCSRGALPQCMLGYHPPRTRHPPPTEQTSPQSRHPTGSRHPPPLHSAC